MNNYLRYIACIIFFVFFSVHIPLYASDSGKTDDHTPEPYTKAEFPLWQRELRRFEILAFGALPFVTLLSFWGYDMIRAAQHPKDPRYYPWPLKQADQALPLTEKEQKGIFFTAAGISITIALIDITYRAIKRSIERKRLERENLYEDEPIQFIPAPADKTNTEPSHAVSAEPPASKEPIKQYTPEPQTTQPQNSSTGSLQ